MSDFLQEFPPPVEKYVSDLMAGVKAKNPGESEFHQAVQEVAESLTLVLDREPRYRKAKVLERIIEDGRSIERALESLHREFLLDLSPGFVYDLLRDRVAQLDLAEHRRMILEHFSGTEALST